MMILSEHWRLAFFAASIISVLTSLFFFVRKSAPKERLEKIIAIPKEKEQFGLHWRTQLARLIAVKNSILLYIGLGALLGGVVASSEPIANWDVGIRGLVVSLFIFLGYRFPSLRNEAMQKKHQAQIDDDFPNVLDILIIMLDAGASFDEALSRFLSDKLFKDRPIKRELARLANELQVTPNRQSAFQKFSYSSKLQNLRLFSSVLIQSEIYGTPISKGLRGLVVEMRQKQFSEIEAKSGALGPKLAIPMTLFFLPLIFIVVLAPTLIRAFKLS